MKKDEYIPSLPDVPNNFRKLERHIASFEQLEGPLKSDNEARIVWQNPDNPGKTPFSFVYLHGFTASQGEGEPLHRTLARETGSNLFLTRITGHGLINRGTRPLDEAAWLQSARYALSVGLTIGERVILLGTSTGATLALYLAAHYPQLVQALLLYSPLIGFANERIHLLEGRYINRMAHVLLRRFQLEKSEHDRNPMWNKYWYTSYRFEEILALVRLIKTYMTKETFKKITQPLFMGYYYKSREIQDDTVSVDAMLEMFDSISTPQHLKQKQAYPDAEGHVITSKFTTTETDAVISDSLKFLQDVVMHPDA